VQGVIPAFAGIQQRLRLLWSFGGGAWTPAFAGVTTHMAWEP
jgi:hypothetical protein